MLVDSTGEAFKYTINEIGRNNSAYVSNEQ